MKFYEKIFIVLLILVLSVLFISIFLNEFKERNLINTLKDFCEFSYCDYDGIGISNQYGKTFYCKCYENNDFYHKQFRYTKEGIREIR